MDVKNLMVGDLVRVNKDVSVPKGAVVKIRGIDADNTFLKRKLIGSVDCVPVGDFDMTYGVWVEYLDPIPLTDEFFEKNGWFYSEKENCNVKSYCIYDEYSEVMAHEFSDGMWRVEYDCMEMGGIPTQSVNICFVHELQHFLNQCGIERKIKV